VARTLVAYMYLGTYSTCPLQRTSRNLINCLTKSSSLIIEIAIGVDVVEAFGSHWPFIVIEIAIEDTVDERPL